MSIFDISPQRPLDFQDQLSECSREFRASIRILTAHYCHLTEWNYGSLKAPFWRVYWNRQDGGVLKSRGHKIHMDPGRLLIIPPEVDFDAHLEKPFDHAFVHFNLIGSTRDFTPEIHAVPFDKSLQDLLAPLLPKFPFINHSEVLHLQAFLMKALAMVPDSFWKDRTINPRLSRLLHWMEQHLHEHDRNEALARQVHLSPTAFSRWFKGQTGISPQRWLDETRMNQACDLLHQPSLTIEEIALLLGYTDRFHFSRTFKKVRGVPPGRFRKNILSA